MILYKPHKPIFYRCSDCRRIIGRSEYDLCRDCSDERDRGWESKQYDLTSHKDCGTVYREEEF